MSRQRTVNEIAWEVQTLHTTKIGDWNAVAREEPNGAFTWAAWDDTDWFPPLEGAAPTIEEAKRLAVEAARRTNNENV